MLADSVYERVRQREREEPGLVREVLLTLVDRDRVVEPTREHVALALDMVDQRGQADRATWRERALSTAAVVEAVAAINDRRSVDARRRRGKLIGLRAGRETYHPDWQFVAGAARERLDEVIELLLAAAGTDVVVADAIMREPRAELDGATLVDLYDQGRVDEILAFLVTRTEGFVP